MAIFLAFDTRLIFFFLAILFNSILYLNVALTAATLNSLTKLHSQTDFACLHFRSVFRRQRHCLTSEARLVENFNSALIVFTVTQRCNVVKSRGCELHERRIYGDTVNRLVSQSSRFSPFPPFLLREYFLSATVCRGVSFSISSKFLLLSPIEVYYVCYVSNIEQYFHS